jgi:serine protease
VTVLLRDPTSRAIAATTTTDVARDYRYSFADVAPGKYEIVATTDLDQNGEICDTGEECGAYPERAAPIAVDVFGGAVVSARDFGLGLVILETDRLQ